MIPVRRPKDVPAPYPKEARRRDLRNYGVAFAACLVGILAGYFIQRSGWGGGFGQIFAALSFMLGIASGLAFLLAWRG